MIFNAIFNNISVISWRSVLMVEEAGVLGINPDLPQVSDKLYDIKMYRVHFVMSEIRTLLSRRFFF